MSRFSSTRLPAAGQVGARVNSSAFSGKIYGAAGGAGGGASQPRAVPNGPGGGDSKSSPLFFTSLPPHKQLLWLVSPASRPSPGLASSQPWPGTGTPALTVRRWRWGPPVLQRLRPPRQDSAGQTAGTRPRGTWPRLPAWPQVPRPQFLIREAEQTSVSPNTKELVLTRTALDTLCLDPRSPALSAATRHLCVPSTVPGL